MPFNLLNKVIIDIEINKLNIKPINMIFSLFGSKGSSKIVGLLIISQGSSSLAFSREIFLLSLINFPRVLSSNVASHSNSLYFANTPSGLSLAFTSASASLSFAFREL